APAVHPPSADALGDRAATDLTAGAPAAPQAGVPSPDAGGSAVPGSVGLQVLAAFLDPVVAVLVVEGVRPGAHDDVRGRCLGGEVEGVLDLLLGETFGAQVALDLRLPVGQDPTRAASHGGAPRCS